MSIQVIKITKTWSAGKTEHFLVLTRGPYFADEIDAQVTAWCERDPNGKSNGYDADWFEVTDKKTIVKVVRQNIMTMNAQISAIERDKKELRNYLKTAKWTSKQ